ncbi:unnamed protein product [Heligmosomoides polygyrus]|uniref:Large ribosomal subunit protein eL38 n=1 Tax=Heligmosomoides polygyrus TaxID=6339 RepID=A0A183FX70_HELPZ|nr:unnamed protein product [Heligmosomoides polygyrus]
MLSLRRDAKIVKIKKNALNVKLKVRYSKYLVILVVSDMDKAEKLKQSLPPGQQSPLPSDEDKLGCSLMPQWNCKCS